MSHQVQLSPAASHCPTAVLDPARHAPKPPACRSRWPYSPRAMTTTGWSLLEQAHEALRTAVVCISEDGRALRTLCEEWNVAQVLRHAADEKVRLHRRDHRQRRSGENPFAPSATPPGQPSAFVDATLSSATRAFGIVASRTRQVSSPLPQEELPAETVVGAVALDAAAHAWDIAAATRQTSLLAADLAAQLIPAAWGTELAGHMLAAAGFSRVEVLYSPIHRTASAFASP